MNLTLDEETTMVRDMARDFAQKELLPRAKQHDLDEAIDPAVFETMKELGLWGLTVPEEYEGAGMGNFALVNVLEEINYACASTGVTLSVHNSLIGSPLQRFGNDAQKREWLPTIADGTGPSACRILE